MNCLYAEIEIKQLTMKTPMAIMTLGLILLSAPLHCRSSDLLDNWTWRNPLPNGDFLSGAAYGNGVYVAVGSGSIHTSPDGSQWTRRVSGNDWSFGGIIFADGKFVAMGGADTNGAVFTSTDGVVWTPHILQTSAGLDGVAYGLGRFVAVGGGGAFFTSTNGIDWSSGGVLPGFALALGVTFANQMFVAVGIAGKIASSPDGLTWTPRSSGTAAALVDVTFGKGLFVAVGGSAAAHGIILTSPNGVTWTPRVTGTTGNFAAIAYDNGRFVTVGDQPGGFAVLIRWSTNGISWSPAAFPPPVPSFSRLAGVTGGNGLFLAVGEAGTLVSSPDGNVWTLRGSGVRTGGNLTAITHGNNLFVAVGGGQTNAAIVTSPDGYAWTERDPGVPVEYLLGICHGQSQFVAVGTAGKILTSPDGVTWRSRSSGTTFDVSSITYGNGLFVALGNNYANLQRSILTSFNGSNWVVRTTQSGNTFGGVAYGNGLFVAVGGNGSILTSTNGIAWTPRTSGRTEALFAVTFGNGQFVAVEGYSTNALTSSDGITWIPRGGDTFYGAYSITFGDGLFVAGGIGFIYTSTDGAIWTRRRYGAVIESFGLACGGGQFLMVGTTGAIVGCDVRPRLNQISFPAGDVAQISISGVAGVRYSIEASTNLTDWNAVTNVLATNGTASFIDSSAPNSSPRFYRGVLVP